MEITYPNRVRKLGDSLAVIIPKEYLKHREKIEIGQVVLVTIKTDYDGK
ncbi:MAG: hypothetical protein AABX33_03180 [Nanoarchaeota archaeon]